MQSVYWEYIENQNLEKGCNNHRSAFQCIREIAMKMYITYMDIW